jgi:hypothetical protein
MATGENNTTWGDVTNLNLGTALEEAIVGSADVTFASADVTLTLTDTNASQTARNMRLRCTGTTGGSTRNLIVPSIEKPYIVRNDCADSVVVKTAAGTGITVPAGKTMWVYSDATNVVDAVTHLSSLTLGTDLAVSDGGTGASTFTANGVIYGNTTSALLATAAGTTGQVLVGNTGGAPSWATLTGIGVTSFSAGTTGFTPSTATTGVVTLGGTLGVANGGTGTTTAFTAGSVVFAGASGVYSQDNANLFWDDTNDRLGIGTATPSFRLQVQTDTDANAGAFIRNSNTGTAAAGILTVASPVGNISVRAHSAANSAWPNSTLIISDSGFTGGLNLFQNGANPIRLWTNGSERMRITSAGDVGIGTTSPTRKLTVSGTTTALMDFGASSFRRYTIGSESLGFIIFDDNASAYRMVVDSSGNVGIGVTPSAWRTGLSDRALDVGETTGLYFQTAGTTALLNNAYRGAGNTIRYKTTGSAHGYWQENNAGVGTHYWTTAPSGTAGDAISFTQAMTLDASGNLGIGTTTTTTYFTNYTSVRNSGFSGAALGLEVGGQPRLLSVADNSASYISSYDDNPITFSVTAGNFAGSTGTERMRIDSSGNVGIGTSSPSTKLDVSGTIRVGAGSTDPGTGGVMYIVGSGQFQTVIGGAAFAVNTGPNNARTEAMRIDSSGNVGIGTNAPVTKLSVIQPGAGYGSQATNSGTIQIAAGPASLNAGGGFEFLSSTFASGYGWKISAIDSAGSQLVFGSRQNSASWTEAMRIDASGNVGIGTSSPATKLDVTSSASNIVIARSTAGFAAYQRIAPTGQAAYDFYTINGVEAARITVDGTNIMAFANGSAATERMRIDTSGNLLVGATTLGAVGTVNGVRARSDGRAIISSATDGVLEVGYNGANATGTVVSFYKGGALGGSITTDGSTTAYNTSSDYRLKEIDGPVANSGAYIDALKPVQGSWKADGNRFIGLLAHEVQEVSETPIATGEKDGEEMQAMDYSAPELIANLIAEIQSLRARVAQLEGN